MNSSGKETLVSLNFNFSNSGGDHSLSIESIKNAKDLSQEGNELGTIIGSSAGRATLSNETLQRIINNFQEVRKTTRKDGTATRVHREFSDITSLKLKSHCFIVRGSQCHPKDERAGSDIIMPYFSECTNSPITNPSQKFPFRGPNKTGGIVRIGNIYNEESSVTSEGVKTSLVYQNNSLVEKFSYNSDQISNHYKANPDYSNYDLRYGYTLTEAKQGLAQCGIHVQGLPSNGSVLFQESGTLDAIISNIASKFGYYWFVDPFSGAVKFVNSASAAALPPLNPLEQSEEVQRKYINASFTQDKMSPVIVNAFSSQIEKKQQTFEFDQGDRRTRFKKVSLKKLLSSIDVSTDLLKLYYGMHLAGKYTQQNFDVMGIIATRQNDNITWKESEWASSLDIADARAGGSEILTGIEDNLDEYNKGAMDLKTGKFIQLKNSVTGEIIERPSGGEAYGKIQNILNLLHNKVFVSNYYLQYTARRINWTGSEMSISGPYEKGTMISDIEALADVFTALKSIGGSDISLNKLMQFAGSEGTGDYGFVGIKSGSSKAANGADKEELDYSLFTPSNYQFTRNKLSEYLAVTGELNKKIKSLADASAVLFKNQDKDGSQTARAYFTRSKRPTDELETDKTRKEEEAAASRQARLDEISAKLSELFERFDIKYYDLKTNGASGNPLNPITLDLKNGKIADIKALAASNFSASQSNRFPPSESSRTIVGISLPSTFKPTISGITLEFGSSGVTTTIKESTVKLLKPDEQLIIDANMNAVLTTKNSVKFTANQRNFLGL